MSRFYKTANGKNLDFDRLRIQNEKAVAIGNMKVNARGDLIDSTGKIIKTRNELMKDHYNSRKKDV